MLNRVLPTITKLPAMGDGLLGKVRKIEQVMMTVPQVPIATYHLVHAGMYARSIMIPKDVMLTGALIKRATILIINGEVELNIGDEIRHLVGYHVIPASAQRKQVFMAIKNTHMTMLFATQSMDIKQIEEEFTDEADILFSRKGQNFIDITGE